MRPALLALVAAAPASALRAAPRAPPPPRVGRREIASLAAGFALLTADSRAALAAGTMSDIRTDAERGAEPAYKMQPFADTVCVERTPLGACREYGAVPGAPAKPPVERVDPSQLGGAKDVRLRCEGTCPEDSELIQYLKKKSDINREANDRETMEKTVKANLAGTFGPFSSEGAVMKENGEFDILPKNAIEKLRDRGYVVTSKTGLDAWKPGFVFDAETMLKNGGKTVVNPDQEYFSFGFIGIPKPSLPF